MVASSRHHHYHPVRRAAAGLGGLGTVLLLNTARAFLVRLPLSFGPPIAHPYQPTVRWAGASSASTPPPTESAAADGSGASSSSSGASNGGPTPVKLPGAVSPSSLGDFKTCPRLYRFRHIERVPEPASEVMVRGSMVHDALDQLFLQPPANRTEAVLHDLFRAVWLKRKDKYLEELFPTVDRQRAFGLAGLKLLSNYYKVERPEAVEPLMREHRMRVPLANGPNVTGILDRVDEEEEEMVVVDYKTGKAPNLRYSDAVNQRIISDKFFQLKIYAMLLHETTGRLPVKLKLIYLDGPTVMTMKLRPEDVDEARAELSSLWDQICAAAAGDAFPTKPGKICEWCSFKSICPAWNFPPPGADLQQQQLMGVGSGNGGEEGVVTGPEADIIVAVENEGSSSGEDGIQLGGGPVGLALLGNSGDESGSDGEGSSSSAAGRRGRKAGSSSSGGDGGEGAAPPAAAAAAAASADAPAPARKKKAATSSTTRGRKPRASSASSTTTSSSSSTASAAAAATGTTTQRRRKAAVPKEDAVVVGSAEDQQQQQQQLFELAAAAAAAVSLSASSGKVAQAAEGRV